MGEGAALQGLQLFDSDKLLYNISPGFKSKSFMSAFHYFLHTEFLSGCPAMIHVTADM